LETGLSSKDFQAAELIQPTQFETHPPPGLTLFVKIDLGIADRAPETAIYIPDGFSKGPDIDIVLYLHGFQQPDGVRSISQYLMMDYGQLRQRLNASGRNVILVAPTLGPESQPGNLTAHGGLDLFLGRTLAAIHAHAGDGWPDVLSLRSLIIACHSGAGVDERELAGGSGKALASLKSSWGYESLYHGVDVPFWSGWARNHESSRLLLFYRPHNSPENAEMVSRCKTLGARGLANLIATPSNAGSHMLVPVTHFQACLEGAAFLNRKPELVA
jgi:hypothetical protein